MHGSAFTHGSSSRVRVGLHSAAARGGGSAPAGAAHERVAVEDGELGALFQLHAWRVGWGRMGRVGWVGWVGSEVKARSERERAEGEPPRRVVGVVEGRGQRQKH